MNHYFETVSIAEQKKEKTKARELRKSQWWKNQLAKGLCYHCGNPFHPSELSMDHLIPLARGGKSNKSNLVPACKECNNKKSYKTVFEMKLEELQNP